MKLKKRRVEVDVKSLSIAADNIAQEAREHRQMYIHYTVQQYAKNDEREGIKKF